MSKINCPLMKEEIEEVVCFDISMVVEDGAPLWSAPKEATDTKDFKAICLSCPNHRNE